MSKSFFNHEKIFVIAEAGKNFIVTEKPGVAQCLDEARTLARYAKECGADAVKFQTHVAEDEAPRRAKSRHEWIKLNEDVTPLEEFWIPLKKYCDEIGILFMTSPMSIKAAEKINDLVTVWKVGSGDTDNGELLEYMISTKKPIILSTGMSSKEEVDRAYQQLADAGADFALLQCTSLYPCPVNRLNLSVIKSYCIWYDCPIGFSDHSQSVTVPVLAVRAGARIIEKHLTIDKTSIGPDHRCSLDVKEFRTMVSNVRQAEEELFAWGTGEKKILPEEEAKRAVFRL